MDILLQWVTANGFPINNIVFTVLTVTLCSDVCKYGIRGYNDKGLAWFWHIPPEFHGIFTLILLELLASETSI